MPSWMQSNSSCVSTPNLVGGVNDIGHHHATNMAGPKINFEGASGMPTWVDRNRMKAEKHAHGKKSVMQIVMKKDAPVPDVPTLLSPTAGALTTHDEHEVGRAQVQGMATLESGHIKEVVYGRQGEMKPKEAFNSTFANCAGQHTSTDFERVKRGGATSNHGTRSNIAQVVFSHEIEGHHHEEESKAQMDVQYQGAAGRGAWYEPPETKRIHSNTNGGSKPVPFASHRSDASTGTVEKPMRKYLNTNIPAHQSEFAQTVYSGRPDVQHIEKTTCFMHKDTNHIVDGEPIAGVSSKTLGMWTAHEEGLRIADARTKDRVNVCGTTRHGYRQNKPLDTKARHSVGLAGHGVATALAHR